MIYENPIYEKKDGVAKITINRPKVLNALSPVLLLEIKAAQEGAVKSVGPHHYIKGFLSSST